MSVERDYLRGDADEQDKRRRGKGSSLGAWDIAATLGLVAVAFVVERTAPVG